MKNCTYVLRFILICVFATIGILPVFSQQIEKGLNSSTGDYLGFLEYKPTDYNQTTTKYPLIIFLHGIGERGNGTTMLQDVTCCGIPRIIKLGHKMKFNWNGKSEQFLVISPQCPEKYGMWPAVFIKELIAYAKNNLRVDPNRIYMTGLSMGGGGTFRFISTAEGDVSQISAAAPICTPCTFSSPTYAQQNNLPVWAFHAADDPTASVTCTYNAINRLNEVKVEPAPLMTIWPTGGHIVWDRVYTDTAYRYDGVLNIYEWFLGQNKTLPVNKLPVARVGSTINITTGTAAATLDGSASSDVDGRLVRYVWKKLSGPAAGTITTAFGTNSSTSVTGLTIAGTYKYQLNVVDDRAGVSRDTLTVVVSSGASVPNESPIAKAGNDANVTLPTNTATLNGSSSSDPDGSISEYLWTKVSGPAATIASSTSATTAVNGLVEGTYVFKLKVTDNKGATAEDQVTIVVIGAANVAPVAKAGADITITLPTNTVTLNGSTSTDADGTISRYLWSKVSGPAATIANTAGSSTAVNSLVEGTYVFKLRVTDNDGATAEDEVTVKVNAAPNVAPVAKAGADITITLPTNTVTLNGSTSTDSDGSIAGYLWTKVSGPAATIAASTAASTAINGLVEGTYVFKLRVTDNDGAYSEDDVTIKVNAAPNVAPVAKAGVDITITLPTNTVTLNGSTSTDSDGSIAGYLWTKVSGPAATIATSTEASTAINNLVEGTYVFRLKVTDNDGASSQDDVTVIVNPKPNEAPNSNAGTDITITLPTNTVTLNGSASSDPDGTISRYIWSKVSGPAATIVNTAGASTAVNNLVEGTYVFRLRVTDNSGATDDDQVTVIVSPNPNVAPVAKAGNDITITLPINTVTLNGNGSTDSDGTISNYLWSKVSGPAATIVNTGGASTAVNNLVEGTYIFRLRVTDNDGATNEDLIAVRVNPAENVAPIARAGNDITITLPENRTALSGVGSTDADGTIASYAWAKLSGPSQFIIANTEASLTSVTNLVEGTYVFRLLVTDNDGATAADTVVVRVNPAPPPPNVVPLAQAGENQTITLPDNDVELDGTASSDPDGTIASYTWSFVSGPATYNLSNATSATANVTGLGVGTYSFKLVVTDNDGATDADTISIIVEEETTPPPPPNVAPVAKAGNDITITLPVNQVSFDGSSSNDEDGTITNYTWTKISGPESYNVVSPSSAETIIENLVEGIYQFQLQVKDNDGAISEDTIRITVLPAPNEIPASAAGADIEVQLPDADIELNGTGSYDPDGTIAAYKWEQVSGPNTASIGTVAGSTTAITGVQEGVYVFRLTVTDNDGAKASDVVRVTVLAAPIPNVVPTAKAGTDIEITLPDASVQLNGSTSSDIDGTIIEYKWEKVSGPNANIATPGSSTTEVNGLLEGEYTFRLTVVDNDGAQASDVVKVIVHSVPNVAPNVVVGNDIDITLPVSSVELDGSASTDRDGNIIEFRWDFVSGPTRAAFENQLGAITTVNDLVEGVYEFRLTVTDNNGDQASDNITVTVHPAPVVEPPVDTTVIITPPVNVDPVADAGNDQTISFPDSSSTINGGNSKDDDGSIAEYNWTMIEGPSAATIVNPESPATSINNLQTGEYKFVLTVIDNKGAVARDTVSISVINTQRFTEDFRVYPNPAASNINVQLTSDTLGAARITIYSASGNVVHVANADKVQPQMLKNLNIGHLQTGLYYLEVIVAGKERRITKFIKKQ